MDPDVIYQIRDDGGVILTKKDIGSNACGIFTHAGSTVTGLSGMELDSGTTNAPAENASFPLLIIGCSDIEDNEYDGAADTRMIWDVVINMHQLRATGDGDGALGEQGA
jgi:hypothetical protein